MFLRNYYNYLAINAFKSFSNTDGISTYTDVSKSTFEAGSLSLKRRGGTVDKTTFTAGLATMAIIPYSYIGTYSSSSYYYSSSGYGVMVFGSGDTPVTFDDYCLANQFSSSVMPITSVSSSNVKINSVTYNSTTKKYTASVSVMVTNSSNSSITIKEFGFGNYYYLYYREVLSTPLTIGARESAWLNYNVEVTVPEL